MTQRPAIPGVDVVDVDGAYVVDAAGRRYLDVASAGHPVHPDSASLVELFSSAMSGLRRFRAVTDTRIDGLSADISVVNAPAVARALRTEGVLVGLMGTTTLRISAPSAIGAGGIDELAAAFARVLGTPPRADVELLPEVTTDEAGRSSDDVRRFLDEVPPHHA